MTTRLVVKHNTHTRPFLRLIIFIRIFIIAVFCNTHTSITWLLFFASYNGFILIRYNTYTQPFVMWPLLAFFPHLGKPLPKPACHGLMQVLNNIYILLLLLLWPFACLRHFAAIHFCLESVSSWDSSRTSKSSAKPMYRYSILLHCSSLLLNYFYQNNVE